MGNMANMNAKITIGTNIDLSETLKQYANFKHEIEGNVITYHIAGDKKELDKFIKEVQAADPKVNLTLGFDQKQYKATLEQMESMAGKSAEQIRKIYYDMFSGKNNKSGKDYIASIIGDGKSVKDNAAKIAKEYISLEDKVNKIDFSKVTDINIANESMKDIQKMTYLLTELQKVGNEINLGGRKKLDVTSALSNVDKMSNALSETMSNNMTAWIPEFKARAESEFTALQDFASKIGMAIEGTLAEAFGNGIAQGVGNGVDEAKKLVDDLTSEISELEGKLNELQNKKNNGVTVTNDKSKQRELKSKIESISGDRGVQNQYFKSIKDTSNMTTKVAIEEVENAKNIIKEKKQELQSLLKEFISVGGNWDRIDSTHRGFLEKLGFSSDQFNIDTKAIDAEIQSTIDLINSKKLELKNARNELNATMNGKGSSVQGSGTGTGDGGNYSATLTPKLSETFKKDTQDLINKLGTLEVEISPKGTEDKEGLVGDKDINQIETLTNQLEDAQKRLQTMESAAHVSPEELQALRDQASSLSSVTERYQEAKAAQEDEINNLKEEIKLLKEKDAEFNKSLKGENIESIPIKVKPENSDDFRNELKKTVEGEKGLDVKVTPFVDPEFELEIKNAKLKGVTVEGDITGGNFKPSEVTPSSPTEQPSTAGVITPEEKYQKTGEAAQEAGKKAKKANEDEAKSVEDIIRNIRELQAEQAKLRNQTNNSDLESHYIDKYAKYSDWDKNSIKQKLVENIKSLHEPNENATPKDIEKGWATIVALVERYKKLTNESLKLPKGLYTDDDKKNLRNVKSKISNLNPMTDKDIAIQLSSLTKQRNEMAKTADEANKLANEIYESVSALEELKTIKNGTKLSTAKGNLEKIDETAGLFSQYKQVGGSLEISDFTSRAAVINSVTDAYRELIATEQQEIEMAKLASEIFDKKETQDKNVHKETDKPQESFADKDINLSPALDPEKFKTEADNLLATVAIEKKVDLVPNELTESGKEGKISGMFEQINAVSLEITQLVEQIDKIPHIDLKYDISDDATREALDSLSNSVKEFDIDKLNSVVKTLSGLNINGNIATNIQKIANAMLNLKSNLNNVAPGSIDFLNSIKEMLGYKEQLSDLATILNKTAKERKDAVESAKNNANGFSDKPKTKTQLSNELYASITNRMREMVKLTKDLTSKNSDIASHASNVLKRYEEENEAVKKQIVDQDLVNKGKEATLDILQEQINKQEMLNEAILSGRLEHESYIDSNTIDLNTLLGGGSLDANGNPQTDDALKALTGLDEEWDRAIQAAHEYQNVLGNVVDIERTIRKDGDNYFESYKITGKDGNSIVKGLDGNYLLSHQKVVTDLSDQSSKVSVLYDEIIDRLKDINKLQQGMSKMGNNEANVAKSQIKRLQEQVRYRQKVLATYDTSILDKYAKKQNQIEKLSVQGQNGKYAKELSNARINDASENTKTQIDNVKVQWSQAAADLKKKLEDAFNSIVSAEYVSPELLSQVTNMIDRLQTPMKMNIDDSSIDSLKNSVSEAKKEVNDLITEVNRVGNSSQKSDKNDLLSRQVEVYTEIEKKMRSVILLENADKGAYSDKIEQLKSEIDYWNKIYAAITEAINADKRFSDVDISNQNKKLTGIHDKTVSGKMDSSLDYEIKNAQKIQTELANTQQRLNKLKAEGSGNIFNNAFKTATTDADKFDQELKNGQITLEQYRSEIKNILNELAGFKNAVKSFDKELTINEAQEEMKKYIAEVSKGRAKFESMSEDNAGYIQKMVYAWEDDDKIIHRITMDYDQMNNVMSASTSQQIKNIKEHMTWTQRLKARWAEVFRYIASFASFYQIWAQIKQGVTYVKELDTALTEMRKVSDETVESLKEFQKVSFDIADSIGSTAKEIQNSAADWMRLGYTLQESSELAKNSNIYANVGDMEIDEATEHMISSVKAWGSEFSNEVEASTAIIDKYNQVGLNRAYTCSNTCKEK